MSGFTAQALERKLVDLNNSQQSIQTLSLWLIHHRKHHKSIVQTWFAELKKAKPSRRLTFMYLANDVIQNSRKKGPEYSKEFGAVLKASFEVVAKDSDDKTLSSLDRMLSIWEQRNIYESNQINSFKATLSSRKSQQTVKELNNSNNNSNNNNNNNNSNNSNNNNNNNDSNVKQKDKEKEKNREKRSEHHKKDVHKNSKELKQTNDKRVKDSKKRLHENSKEVIPSKKRSTDESKKSSVISHNETKLKISKSVDKIEKIEKKTTTTTVTPIVNTGLGNIVDPEVLIKALQELESSASADAGVRQKIASLPTEVFDATLLDKIRDKGAAERLTKLVEEARSLLADYNSRLAQELEDRKHISVILSNFTQNQRNALSLAEQKLNEYKEKLRKVVQVRNELKSHLQNLPDLSRLPSVTGLAPLPSACDLFNVARNVNSAGGSVTSSVSPNESMASPIDCGTPGSNTSL